MREKIGTRVKKTFGLLAALLMAVLILGNLTGCGAAVELEDGIPEELIQEIEREVVSEVERQVEKEIKAGLESAFGREDSGQEEDGDPDTAELTVEEDGQYTSKEEVALYLHTYGKLPSNYITKREAEALGWKKKEGKAGQLQNVAPGKSIGGDHYGNYEEQLPEKKGRKYFECDINYVSGNRGEERIIYSNDGLIFYTGDHYETFEQLYPKEEP